jgi:hypothetical protein
MWLRARSLVSIINKFEKEGFVSLFAIEKWYRVGNSMYFL